MAHDSEKIYESIDKLLNDINNILDIISKELIRKKNHIEYLEKRIEEESNNNLLLKKVLNYYADSSHNKI